MTPAEDALTMLEPRLIQLIAAGILIAGSIGIHADQSAGAPSVVWQPGGAIRLSAGNRVATPSLADDIVGCLGTLFDPTTRARHGSGEGKHKVLDVAGRNGHHFILLSAVAAPNCNVQGRCGAGGPNVTLIWLDVRADLSVAEKRALAVADCLAPRWVESDKDDWWERLALVNGSLTLSFTELSKDLAEVPGRVTYSHATAHLGPTISRAAR